MYLSGRAVSNVFNDVTELDSGDGNVMVLKGLVSRCDVGLLSLFEHYRSCQVNDYICSFQHFFAVTNFFIFFFKDLEK